MDTNIERILYDALADDIPEYPDETEILLRGVTSEAVFHAGTRGVLMGMEILIRLFEIVDDTVVVKAINHDGVLLEEGEVIAIVSGDAASIHKTIPTVTTFLSRLSTIATTVTPLAVRLHEHAIQLFAPKSDTPLFHVVEAYAYTRSGAILENDHVLRRLTPFHYQVAGGVQAAVNHVRPLLDNTAPLVCEVETFEQYTLANQTFCDIIVLYASTVEQANTMFTAEPPHTTVHLDLREAPTSLDDLCRLPIAAVRLPFHRQEHPFTMRIEHHEIGRDT
jgi:nicotinate-nucleotide pyrophosphorylase